MARNKVQFQKGLSEAQFAVTPPFKSVRKPSTSGVGQAERLARVRFLTRPASRKLSRNRTAGGEPRLGTDSIYMALFLAVYIRDCQRTLMHYMGTIPARKWQQMPQKTAAFIGSAVKTSG